MLGKKVGPFTILSEEGSRNLNSLWKVRCDCGEVSLKSSGQIKATAHGCSKRCPLARVAIGKGNTRHGMSYHKAYHVYRSMVDRCRLPTHQAYKNYGGRGIYVCKEWSTFERFWEDMGPTYREGLCLDRKDNDDGYYKANCRWVPHETNGNNKRNSRLVQTEYGPMNVATASKIFGIGVTTILYRINRGWPAHLLFIEPDLARTVVGR